MSEDPRERAIAALFGEDAERASPFSGGKDYVLEIRLDGVALDLNWAAVQDFLKDGADGLPVGAGCDLIRGGKADIFIERQFRHFDTTSGYVDGRRPSQIPNMRPAHHGRHRGRS